MSKKTYRLTDQAPIELRRTASARGLVVLSDRAAKYELMRETVDLVSPIAVPAKADRTAGD